MWAITGSERRLCPPEYQEHLNRLGGLNRYGEPNFKLVWGQTQTDVIFGQMEDGSRGQHIILQFHDIPAWHLMCWKPPETFGSPEMWYAMTWDEETHLHTLGDYPRRGFYIPAPFSLYVKRIENGILEIDAMPLNFFILDLVVPNLIKSQEMTYYQKKLAADTMAEAERRAARNQALDAYKNAGPAFGGADFDKSQNRGRMLDRIRAQRFPLSAEDVKRWMGTGHVVTGGPGGRRF